MRRRIASLLTVLVLAVLVGACTTDPYEEEIPTSAAAEAADANLSDPDTVIRDALETMFTWAPAEEDSPAAAYARAGVYLSDALAGEASTVTVPGPGTQWQEWRANNAIVEATAYLLADETPTNSADQRHRVAVVVQSATVNGSLIDEIRRTAWVVADRSDSNWRVTSMQFS